MRTASAARRIHQAFAIAASGLIASQAPAQTLPPPPVSPAPVVRMEYDAQGNPTRQVLAPGVANLSTSTAYDRLARATQSTDARGKPTQMAYDGRDNLLQVTDPRGLITQYPRNGLGDAVGLASPDTGVATHTLDAAGNLKTRTDSRGVTATYSYDALNRLTSVVFSQGAQSQGFGWTYDQTGPGFSNGIGRLTSTQFPGGASTYGYDAQGRLITQTQTVSAGSTITLKVAYGYDASGNLTSITYPSGRVLLVPHSGGQPTAVALAPSAGTAALPLMSNLQFNPTVTGLGQLRSWNWEMNSGQVPNLREYDVHGRMVRHSLGGAVRDITYDASDRIAAFTHLDGNTGQASAAAQALNQSFGYDELGRLTSVSTTTTNWAYTYDDNGNRLSQSIATGGQPQDQQYGIASNSNRLVSISNPLRTFAHDAAGNTLTDQQTAQGIAQTYDLSGRLSQVKVTRSSEVIDANYLHDVNGLRVLKSLVQQAQAPTEPGIPIPLPPICSLNPKFKLSYCAQSLQAPGGGTVFLHDPQGQLLGEYDGISGAALREYIWLQGVPAAVVDGSASNPQVYYVQTDHLNTPRVLLDRAGRQRWSWVAEPFGNSTPVEDPIGVGAVKFHLRMPGQYWDEETGLAYNWHRSYDVGVGRYTQSDPIGLQGGINTYLYASAAPTMFTDPDGLDPREAMTGPYYSTPAPRYNAPPPRTVPLSPLMEWRVMCVADCLRFPSEVCPPITVTGGSEGAPYHKGPAHGQGRAMDFGLRSNPWVAGKADDNVKACSLKCGLDYGWFENWGDPHWHFQAGPGGRVPPLPTPRPR